MSSDFLIVFIIFGSIAYVIKVLSDNRLRRILVQQGEVNENVKYLFSDKFALSVPASLKWGMVFIAVGAAILVTKIIDIFTHADESLMFSLMFIFGGVALLVYYGIGSRMLKEEKSQ